MYCKFDHSEMIFGPFEKMTFFGEHPLSDPAENRLIRGSKNQLAYKLKRHHLPPHTSYYLLPAHHVFCYFGQNRKTETLIVSRLIGGVYAPCTHDLPTT